MSQKPVPLVPVLALCALVFCGLAVLVVVASVQNGRRRQEAMEEGVRAAAEAASSGVDVKKRAQARAAEAEEEEERRRKADELLNAGMDKARTLDGEALKKARGEFATSIKGQLGCSLSQVEGKDQDVLHVEGCSLGTPGVEKERFQTMKNLGFWVLHSSQGKAKCSYFMSDFPPVVTAQRIWKCKVGDAWPTP